MDIPPTTDTQTDVPARITTYIEGLAESLIKMNLEEFFRTIHNKYYSDKDISFMDYFLEIIDKDNEFYIHHSKLIEYGIMTSTRSNDIKTKLDNYDLTENTDYRLRDISQPVNQGGFVTSKHYYLKPRAFKKCLMRARRYANQPVNPMVYCDYYLLLESVYKYYTEYERLYSKKLLSIKDDKIDELCDIPSNYSYFFFYKIDYCI